MRIQTLLEYDRARAIQALGPNLWKAMLKDQQGLTMLALDELEAYGEKYADSPRGKIIKQVFADPQRQAIYADNAMTAIEDADPSTNKKYTQWMARQFMNGSETKLEDVTSTLADYVDKFNRLNLKRKLPPGENDINRYKTAGALYTAMDRYDDPVDDGDQGKADKVYEDGDVKVVVPRDQAAACAYGRQTRWCTAATKGQNYFEQYNKDGPLYILLPKEPDTPGEKYQLHFQSGSYMDKDDDPVDIGDLLTERFPDLGQWFLTNPSTADDVKDEVAFASDETLQKISDDIWEIVRDVVMDDYSQWESSDDGFYDWLREEGYVDEDGDIDWDRAPPYEKYNPDAMRWITDVEEFAHLRPNQLRRAAMDAYYSGDRDDRSVYNLESAIAWNLREKMKHDDLSGEGVANWIDKNIIIKRTADGPKVEKVVRRAQP